MPSAILWLQFWVVSFIINVCRGREGDREEEGDRANNPLYAQPARLKPGRQAKTNNAAFRQMRHPIRRPFLSSPILPFALRSSSQSGQLCRQTNKLALELSLLCAHIDVPACVYSVCVCLCEAQRDYKQN